MTKNDKPFLWLGPMQKRMLEFMLRHTPDCNKQKRFSISREETDRMVAGRLEARGIINVNRDFECWVVMFASEEMHDEALMRIGVAKDELVFIPPLY